MFLPVVVGPHESGFRASTGAPLDLVADGPTADAAVAYLQTLVADRLRAVEFRTIDVPYQPRPVEAATEYTPDGEFEAYLEAVAEYRRVHNTIPDAD